MRVHTGVAFQSEKMGVVPALALGHRAFGVAGQPFAEPGRRVPAGSERVDNFMQIRRRS
jgi:hypothetical protein